METLSHNTAAGRVEGRYDPRFKPVMEAFLENFERRDEVGASVAVSVEGRIVVDLWGGKKDRDGAPWDEDTVLVVFSSTKGATALCAHMLADCGLLDLDAQVADYWPEYACNGKEETLVSMFLDHSAGLPHVRAALEPGAFYDYGRMVSVLEAEAPFWRPGQRHGYHPITFGWTVGEVVRRVSGQRLGQFFQDKVAGPLGLDFWIGTPEEIQPRVARILLAQPHPAAATSKYALAVLNDPESAAHAFAATGLGIDPNARECHGAEIGSVNGVTNARGLAGLYCPLANGELVGKDTIARMARVSVAGEDASLLFPTRFSLGFMKSMDNRRETAEPPSSCILGDAAFGHVGAGGSIGFADPECRMSFGYVMNRMGSSRLLDERGQSLVDAAYAASGYRSNLSGAWTT